jgi:hypothetical protein
LRATQVIVGALDDDDRLLQGALATLGARYQRLLSDRISLWREDCICYLEHQEMGMGIW